MSDKPKTRHIVTVNVTVLAEDRDTAIRHVNAALLTDPSGLKFADPIERWLVDGVTEGPSPWQSAKTEKPAMDGRPFFARDATMEGNEEFATAVRWHPEKNNLSMLTSRNFRLPTGCLSPRYREHPRSLLGCDEIGPKVKRVKA